MLRYRTEIVIPADRLVCLQLPDDLPEGPATVTVRFAGAAGGGDDPDDPGPIDEDDDIEWWEEFEGGAAPRD